MGSSTTPRLSSSSLSSAPSGARPLRVAWVLNWLPVGGVERLVISVLSHLDRARFEPSIILLRERGVLADEAEAAGLPVMLSPMRTRLSPPGLMRLSRLFRQLRLDIVHAHMYRSNTPATIAARMAGVPICIAHIHNVQTLETWRQRAMDRFLNRWRSAVIAVSESVRADVLRETGAPPGLVRVIHNGIDLAPFAAPPAPAERASLREREGLPASAIVFATVARLVPQKNHAGLLRAFAQAAPKTPRAFLWIIGDGPLRQSLEEEAARLGIAARVRFAGKRFDVPRLLPLADLGTVVTYKEGFSLGLVECLAAGLPLVVTDVGGNAEAVREGVEGLIVRNPDDTDAIARAIERLAADGAEGDSLRARMSASARQRAGEFSVETMTSKIAALYDELRPHAGGKS